MNNSQLCNQTSGKTEYYTPPKIGEAAWRVMGGIDLDPASCAAANHLVGATRYFTKNDDGLAHEWSGRVWLNHPYGDDTPRWMSKLVLEYRSGRVTQACSITYAATSESWFQQLYAFPICFLAPRTNYILPDYTVAKGAPKGSAVTYMGPNVDAFVREFNRLGSVMLPTTKDFEFGMMTGQHRANDRDECPIAWGLFE